MKAAITLFLFIPISLMAVTDSAYVCHMGDYDYKGTSYSDNYKVPPTTGQESCLERDKMDSQKIGKDYRENHQKIQDQINKMLIDPECSLLKPFLDEYLEKIKKNEEQFADLTKIRTEFVADKIKQYDVQKAYAYAGAFNGTCSGGHNRKTSFINLEFINKLPQATGGSTEVTKDGEKIDSCADVTASGSNEDLNSFFVSTQKAQGKDFVLTWDPFGVPDQIIVKSKSGQELYNSGCKGSDKLKAEPIKLPLPKDGIVVNVINTCESPNQKGSSWNLRIQCAEPATELCKQPKEELIRLVKEEVNQTKTLIDANKLQQQCYFFIDKDILGQLLSDGMIKEESEPMTNGLCDVMDDSCDGKIRGHAGSELSHQKPALPNAIIPYREPSQEQFKCPEKKDVADSLFKTISYAYCSQGWKRLGLEENLPE